MKCIPLLLIAGFLSLNLFSQTFWHQYSPIYYTYNASVLTPDGGLMIVSNATDSSWMVPRLMRVDSVGGLVWSVQLSLMPDFNRGRFVDIIRTYDDCYLAIGQMISGSNNEGILLHKFDLNGAVKWTKLIRASTCVGITPGYESHCVIEAKDKGFAVSGSCGAPGGEGMFLFKTDSTGNPVWFRAYYDFNGLNFWYRNLCQDSDSGYVFFNQYDALTQDALLIHTDKSGNLLMSATLDSLNASHLNALFNIDGKVYLCFENGFVRSNLDTMPFWLPTYTFPFIGYKFQSMEKCQNSDLILSWCVNNQAFGTLRTDYNGIPVWGRGSNTGVHAAEEFYERPDGKFIYQGTGGFIGNNTVDVILFDSTGTMDCFNQDMVVTRDSIQEILRYAPVTDVVCAFVVYVPPMHWHDVGATTDLCVGAFVKENESANIEVYPNPTNGKIQLRGLHSPSTLEVTGIDGRRIASIETQEQSVILDLSGYPKGIYVIRVINADFSFVTKIILQ